MRRCFIDLLVTPPSPNEGRSIVEAAARLGYCVLGVEAGDETVSTMQEVGGSLGLGIVRVFTAPGARRSEVARALEGAPKGRVLKLAVPKAPDAARYAGANKKLAGFLLSPGLERLVDRSTRRLFMERGWGIVVLPLIHLLRNPGSARTWRFYYVAMRRAYAYGVEMALASGARNPRELWHPYSAAGIAEIVGVPWEAASLWLTSSPARVIERFLGVRIRGGAGLLGGR